jgi:porin
MTGWQLLPARTVAVCLLTGMVSMLTCVRFASPAMAQAWWDTAPNGIPDPSIATSLPHNGDPTDVRKRLSDRGIVFGIEYTNDVLSNVHGGLKTGTIDQGKIQGIFAVDLEKLAGWNGLSLFANFFQIHNTGRIRPNYVGGINTIAAIEAIPSNRLSELWLEQKFANDRASIRIGQLAADNEFFYSELSTLFLQSDWPTIAAVNLPGGGAAYPLSTPGVRLKVQPVKDVTWLIAAYNGDPASQCGLDDPQLCNRNGLSFRVNDPPLMISELQLTRNTGKHDKGLATTLKLGGWYYTGTFEDVHFATDGVPLINPKSSGVPYVHKGNFGLYSIIDQQIYRPVGGDNQSGISVYNRTSFSPNDRNLVDFYTDGGIVFAGMIPGRPNDKFGAGFIYSKFSKSVRSYDEAAFMFTGIPGSIRDYEANLEFTYQAQIAPGWTIQPDLQFIWHPSGRSTIPMAIVAGVRSLWRF